MTASRADFTFGRFDGGIVIGTIARRGRLISYMRACHLTVRSAAAAGIRAVLVALLAGCAAAPDATYDPKGWVGKDVKEVAAVWGNPVKAEPLRDGNTLYFFPRRRRFVDYSEPIPQLVDVDARGIIYFKNEPAYLLRGDSPTTKCLYDLFVVGPDNKVVTWRGFGC